MPTPTPPYHLTHAMPQTNASFWILPFPLVSPTASPAPLCAHFSSSTPRTDPIIASRLLLIKRLIVDRWEIPFRLFLFLFLCALSSIFPYLEYVALYQISYRSLHLFLLLRLRVYIGRSPCVRPPVPVVGNLNRLIMASSEFEGFVPRFLKLFYTPTPPA